MKRLILILSLLVASDALAFSYATGGCATSSCAEGEQWLYTNANEIDTALDSAESAITTLQARDTIAEHESVDGVNVILASEIDTGAKLDTLAAGDLLLAADLGVAVQAYDADLADLADGSLPGSKIGAGLDAAVIDFGVLDLARMHTGATTDTEWDSVAEINAATTDQDFMPQTSALNMLTTGTISSKTSVTDKSAGETLIAAQALDTVIRYTGGGAATFVLPMPEAGYGVCIRTVTTAVVTIDVGSGSHEIILDGVELDPGDSIDSPGEAGAFVCLIGVSSTQWETWGRSGTWIDGDV